MVEAQKNNNNEIYDSYMYFNDDYYYYENHKNDMDELFYKTFNSDGTIKSDWKKYQIFNDS
jgi:hypothetical protein